MKLNEFYKAKTSVVKKPKSQVFTLPDNERKTNNLTKQIQELTTELNRFKDIEQTALTLEIRLKEQELKTEEFSNEKNALFLQFKQQETAQHLLQENNSDLRKGMEQVPILQHSLQEMTTKYNEVSIENSDIKNYLDTSDRNLTESQRVQEELYIKITDLEQKQQENNENIAKITQLNTKLVNDNTEYSKTLSLTLESFRSLELSHQQLLNDNEAARVKIDTLEHIKKQLDGWVKNLNRDYSQSSSKSSALEQKLNASNEVIEGQGETIQALIQDQEDILKLVQYYKKELLKNPPSNVGALMAEMKIPFMGDAVRRQSLGHSKQTLLKFNTKEGDSDDISTL